MHGVFWAYRNTPLTSTGEKPSYLLLGMDCRSTTEVALLPPKITIISNYREEMVLTLLTARTLALTVNQRSQQCYKLQHDKRLLLQRSENGFMSISHKTMWVEWDSYLTHGTEYHEWPTLAFKGDPSQMRYNQKLMHEHLTEFFTAKTMKLLPPAINYKEAR